VNSGAFKLYDINGDGVIDKEEMSRIVYAIHAMVGRQLSKEEAAEKSGHFFSIMDSVN
jgi:Ca2+-binding EF-hand superfamily protein